MQNEFVLGVLDEIWHLYNEEGFVPSTNLKKLFYLEKFFKVLQYFSVKEINEWSNSYMRERTGGTSDPHGKNIYVITIKWILNRSK
ncbi:MAG: hypothetical protein ACFFAH_17055 [Promethearchaeota archaeon]